jgi:hypothetical protein
MGPCWRIELRGLANGTRALFVKGSGERNMMRQRDPIFFNFFFVSTLFEVSKNVFLLLG